MQEERRENSPFLPEQVAACTNRDKYAFVLLLQRKWLPEWDILAADRTEKEDGPVELLRNLPVRHPEKLAGLIDVQPGQVVSMAVSRSEHCQMTLLAFGDGESVSEECYFGDTLYYVLEGGLSVSEENGTHTLYAGDCLAVPARMSHGVSTLDGCKLLQITLA